MLLVTPMQSNAEESGLYLTNKFTALNNGTTYNYEIYSDNPDAKVLVFTSLNSVAYNSYMNAYYYAQPIWVMSIGGDSNISVYKNGALMSSSGGLIEALDMDVINSNLLTNLTVGSLDNNANIGAIEGNWSNYYMNDSAYKLVEFSDVYGYFINVPYDENVGDPTYTTVKYAVENIDDLKVQPEEYDATLGVPIFSHYKDNVREYLSIDNSSGNKVEMKIKIYGPSNIYINSISNDFRDNNLDMYEWAVTAEVSSNLYYVNNYLDSKHFYIWGLENYENATGENFVNLADLFLDFTLSCRDNCTFEYKDYFTQLQDSGNKLNWDMLLSLSNTDLYEYEIYARFYDDSGTSKKYGSWQHLVLERGGTFKQSTDEEGIVELPEDDEDNRDDGDLITITPEVPYEDIDASDLWATISNLVAGMGAIPDIFADIFQMMPSWLQFMIFAGIGAIVVLRFTGR